MTPDSSTHPDATVRRTLLGAACLSLQPLALNALSVPAMAYIIHRLGPEGYAQWMAAVTLLAFLAVLTNLGLRAAFIRTLAADPSTAPRALAEQLGLRLTLSTLAGTIAVLACSLLGYSASVAWCATIGAAGLALTAVATTLGDLLQSSYRNKTLAAVNLAAGLTLTAASVIAAWLDAGPIAMALAYLTGPTLSALLLLLIVNHRICRVSIRWAPARFKLLLTESRFFAAQQLLFAGSAQAEALLSPRIIGMHAFGLFAAGAMLGNRLVALPDALCAAAYPVMVQACGRSIRAGARVMSRFLMLAVLGGIAVAVTGMFVAAPLGRLLLPDQPDLFAFVVRITIWSVPLISAELVMGYALNAAGRDAVQAKLAVPAAAISLAGSVALVLLFGLEGACWSMLFRPAVRAAFLAPVTLKTYRSSRDGRGDESAASHLHPLKKAA